VRAARTGLSAWRPDAPEAEGAGDLFFDWTRGLTLSRQGGDIPADAGLRPEAFERRGRAWRRKGTSRLREYLARGLLPRKLVEAGERFEGTWRRAALDPRVTGAYGEGTGGGFDPFDVSDAQAVARLDLRRVAHALGADLMRVLIRVCVFDESAGAVAAGEMGRGGKGGRVAGLTALSLALRRLFEHYAARERGRE
ncbi:MAG: DUF6456 domain-containing protein, partial [Alphaproteobacteria bacterium]